MCVFAAATSHEPGCQFQFGESREREDKTRVVVVAFNRLEKLILSGIATHLYPILTTINHTPAALANNKNHKRL